MDQTIRFIPRITFVAFVFAAASLASLAQPSPAKSGPVEVTGAPMSGPMPVGPLVPVLPPMLNGVLSAEEYRKFVVFQQHVNEDPAIKDLYDKVTGHFKEIQRLQAEVNVLREKAVAANPEMKALREKITAAMRAHASTGGGPIPMPGPVKSN